VQRQVASNSVSRRVHCWIRCQATTGEDVAVREDLACAVFLKYKTAATSGRQKDTQQGPQADPGTGSHRAGSWVFRQTSENQ
jgi:hypothetical protein